MPNLVASRPHGPAQLLWWLPSPAPTHKRSQNRPLSEDEVGQHPPFGAWDDVPRRGGEVIFGGVIVGQPQKMQVGSSLISLRS